MFLHLVLIVSSVFHKGLVKFIPCAAAARMQHLSSLCLLTDTHTHTHTHTRKPLKVSAAVRQEVATQKLVVPVLVPAGGEEVVELKSESVPFRVGLGGDVDAADSGMCSGSKEHGLRKHLGPDVRISVTEFKPEIFASIGSECKKILYFIFLITDFFMWPHFTA